MKKSLKKAFTLLTLLALPFAMQAQTKFHDVEANDATGPVKKIETNVMGQNQVISFTEDGKMQREGMKDVVYDENGYMQSAKMEMQGMEVKVTYKWENGKIASQTMNIMGQNMVAKRTYNDQGLPLKESMDMGGQEFGSEYKDYKLDDHGNWISRKASMMGQEMEQTRTIEYY